MAEPFLSEIRIMSFGFAPKGWALCNGQLLPINQNQALFSLLGTTFGGDGRVNFALPDLRGRVPDPRRAAATRSASGAASRRTRSRSPRSRRTRTSRRRRRATATNADPERQRPRRSRGQRVYAAPDATSTPLSPATRRERRRQPGAPEHAAVPRP